MPETIHLVVLTPEKKVLDTSVDQVALPGLDGELGILPGHTELVSQLKPAGLLTYTAGDARNEIVINDGFAEIGPQRVVVLADEAARPDEIDAARSLELKKKAEHKLARALYEPDIDVAGALIELEKATVELQVAERKKG
jgi:F-type H+-transporting ATPase subunit epsilon